MHGHGRRSRQARGPMVLNGPPRVQEFFVRRYRCTRCATTVTPLPSGVIRRRLYLASAIALAMVFYGVHRQTQLSVRRKLSPWTIWGNGSASRWDALRGWIAAVQQGRLFKGVRKTPEAFSLWRVAARAAMTLSALGPPGEMSLEASVIWGAARAT